MICSHRTPQTQWLCWGCDHLNCASQVQCAKWFKRVPFAGNLTKQIKVCENNLHLTKLEHSLWIDASTAFIYARALAIPLVLDHLEGCPSY